MAKVRRAPTEQSVWHTSVDELMTLFREALSAVAPVLAKAHIHWERDRAYDDWDSIAQALYTNIVERSLQWSEEVGMDVKLPHYGVLYDDFAARSHIAVADEKAVGDTDQEYAFVEFDSLKRRFDTVHGVLLAGASAGSDVAIPASRARFWMSVRASDGAWRTIRELTVQL